MSNTKYTDRTLATNPPGGKHHDLGDDAQQNRRPSEEGAADKARATKKAAPSKAAAKK